MSIEQYLNFKIWMDIYIPIFLLVFFVILLGILQLIDYFKKRF